jgi:ABC-type antimicrobial peptide transport system permease subunit
VATTVILGAIGTGAGYFPARRAATVNPAESLRYE